MSLYNEFRQTIMFATIISVCLSSLFGLNINEMVSILLVTLSGNLSVKIFITYSNFILLVLMTTISTGLMYTILIINEDDIVALGVTILVQCVFIELMVPKRV